MMLTSLFAAFVLTAGAATEGRGAVAQFSVNDKVEDLKLEDIQKGGNTDDKKPPVSLEEALATGLREAAAGGDADLVNLFLKGGANINAADPDGHTALMYAVLAEHVKVVEVLLRRRAADVDAGNNVGTTALIYAAISGNVEIVTLLVKAGADVKVRDRLNRSPLLSAATAEVLKVLLPFQYKKGCLDGVLKQAEDTSARRNAVAQFSITAGDVKIITVGDLDGKDKKTPTDKKSDRTQETVVLEPFGEELREAAKAGDANLVRLILSLHANVNSADIAGHTALFYAIGGGHPNVVKTLIKRGADVDFADSNNTTPLIFAAKWGNVETVQILLEAGANVRAVNRFGDSALDAAKTLDMLKALLPSYVDNNACVGVL